MESAEYIYRMAIHHHTGYLIVVRFDITKRLSMATCDVYAGDPSKRVLKPRYILSISPQGNRSVEIVTSIGPLWLSGNPDLPNFLQLETLNGHALTRLKAYEYDVQVYRDRLYASPLPDLTCLQSVLSELDDVCTPEVLNRTPKLVAEVLWRFRHYYGNAREQLSHAESPPGCTA